MSTRRSGRAKAPVKYTSDSDGSDFGNKKSRKSVSAQPKKRTKTEQEPSAAGPPKKRAKKDPEVAAAEQREKADAADAKAEKARHQKAWEEWLDAHDVGGKLLDDEPGKDESITQTDAQKKYGVKKEELGSLKHFEKRNPVYNNTMKLYLEADVKELGFRKAGRLDGVEDENEAVKRGEEIWTAEHKNDTPKEDKKSTPKSKTPKQRWSAYLSAHAVAESDALKDEPEDAINQSDCKAKYELVPADLAVLAYFPKPNPKYKNTTKLFKVSEVEELAWRKTAVLAGVEEDGDDAALLDKGKTLFDEGKS